MGLILEDHDLGVSVEVRRESFNIYTDDGEIEIDLNVLDELLWLLGKAKAKAEGGGK